MELSVFIAKLFGVVCVAVGLGMLFNSNYYKKMMHAVMQETGLIYFGGIAALVIGVLIVLNHNIWEPSWVVVITILGWLAVVKGVLLLVFPKSISMFESWFKAKSTVTLAGVCALILGLVLGYFGFVM